MLVRERNDLLDVADRQPAEKKRLRLLEEKLNWLRTAEDPEDQAAMDLIRSVAETLRDSGRRHS